MGIFNRKPTDNEISNQQLIGVLNERINKLEHVIIAMARISKIEPGQIIMERENTTANTLYATKIKKTELEMMVKALEKESK
jgi:hypothetical protein